MTKKSELDAIFQRAEEYYYGQNGQSHDTTKALELYRQAAEQTCVASGLLRHFYNKIK
jgi:hypothetical protein